VTESFESISYRLTLLGCESRYRQGEQNTIQ